MNLITLLNYDDNEKAIIHKGLAQVFIGEKVLGQDDQVEKNLFMGFDCWNDFVIHRTGSYDSCTKITIDLDEINLDPWRCVANKIPVNICFEKWVGEHLAYTEYFDFRKVQEVNSFIRCLQHEDLGRINYTQIDPEYLKQIEAV